MAESESIATSTAGSHAASHAMPHAVPHAMSETSWIVPSAVVIGDVVLGADVSVWPTAVIRGDVERITIGARSNVQDGAVLHADPGMPTIIGADCVIGHRAIVHGSVLEDGVLVIRPLSSEEMTGTLTNAARYVALKERHRAG